MSSIAAGSSGSSSANALANNSATKEATRKSTAEGSLSGGISFSGIGSGTDFQTMIDQLKKIEEIPKNRLAIWRADWQKRVDAFDTLIDGFGDAQKKLSSMNKLSSFLTKLVSSTKESAVTAVADADAPLGSYKLNVVQLATNGMVTTQNTVAAKKSDVIAPTASTFEYTYGTGTNATRSLTIPAGTTLESFINIVNNDTRNPGVKASLIKNGDGYVFQIQGMETGKDNSLEIEAGTTLPGFTTAPGTWYDRQATDALFYLEGRENQILSSASNSLTEVVPGMTIQLKDVTDVATFNPNGTVNTIVESNPVMLTITNDAASAKKKVLEFVETVNELIQTFQELTGYNKNKKTEDITKASSQFSAQKGSVLTGNYGVQLTNSSMRSIFASSGKGFLPLEKDGSGDVFHTLATIGIQMDSDESSKTFGQLVVKEGEVEDGSPFNTIDNALKHDPEAVARILASDKVVRSNSPDFSYVGMLKKDMVTGGDHSVKYNVDGGGVITDCWIDGIKASYDATTKEWTSNAKISAGLVIRADNLTPGTHEGSLSIQQGKINELTDFFSKELKGSGLEVGKQTDEKGSLHVLRENYIGIIDNIDKKIEKEESRLIVWETRQRKKFARLDALLSTYNQQMTANASALGSASSGSGGK